MGGAPIAHAFGGDWYYIHWTLAGFFFIPGIYGKLPGIYGSGMPGDIPTLLYKGGILDILNPASVL